MTTTTGSKALDHLLEVVQTFVQEREDVIGGEFGKSFKGYKGKRANLENWAVTEIAFRLWEKVRESGGRILHNTACLKTDEWNFSTALTKDKLGHGSPCFREYGDKKSNQRCPDLAIQLKGHPPLLAECKFVALTNGGVLVDSGVAWTDYVFVHTINRHPPPGLKPPQELKGPVEAVFVCIAQKPIEQEDTRPSSLQSSLGLKPKQWLSVSKCLSISQGSKIKNGCSTSGAQNGKDVWTFP